MVEHFVLWTTIYWSIALCVDVYTQLFKQHSVSRCDFHLGAILLRVPFMGTWMKNRRLYFASTPPRRGTSLHSSVRTAAIKKITKQTETTFTLFTTQLSNRRRILIFSNRPPILDHDIPHIFFCDPWNPLSHITTHRLPEPQNKLLLFHAKTILTFYLYLYTLLNIPYYYS